MNCVCSVSATEKETKSVLHELYPRLCAFKLREGELRSEGTLNMECQEATDEHRTKFWSSIRAKFVILLEVIIVLRETKEAGSALTALGLLMFNSPVVFSSHADFTLGECKSLLMKSAKDSRCEEKRFKFIRNIRKNVDHNVFVFLKLYVRAYHEKSQRDGSTHIQSLFPLLFSINLSKGDFIFAFALLF